MGRQSLFFFIFFMVAAFKAHSQNLPSKFYLPSLICDDSSNNAILAIYEAKILRGLNFEETSYQDYSDLRSEQMSKAFETLKPYSPARAQSYQRRGELIFPRIKKVNANLATDHSLNEIVIPTNCHLETLAVIETDSYRAIKQVYLSGPIWEKLDGLSQASFWIELLSTQELFENSVEASSVSLGSRLFSGYVLALESPFKDRPTRFQVLNRIGFKYGEFETINLCIELTSKMNWDQDRPMSGYAYGEAFFPECRLQYQGQSLNAAGPYLLNADLRFEILSIFSGLAAEKPGYRDSILSEKYAMDLYFHGDIFEDPQIYLFPSGQIKKGYLDSTNHPNLKSNFFNLDIGRMTFTDYDNWIDSLIEFWPNGNPKKIKRVHGTALIQEKIYEVISDDLKFFENGRLQCAYFKPGTVFKNKNKTAYKITDSNRYVCFDQDSYPYEGDPHERD